MARKHYEGTVVSESSSLLDIERMLRQHGVDQVRWTTSSDLIRVEFVWPYKGVNLGFRIDLDIPQKEKGYNLSPPRREQERRRRLRVLLNHIKAKLVAVEDGIVEMEQEFLPYLIGDGGETLGEKAVRQMREAIALGQVPEVRLLPRGEER